MVGAKWLGIHQRDLLQTNTNEQVLLTFIVSSLVLLGSCNGSDRNKRQLMYPPESIMQLAFAVITPGEVKGRMLTTNLGIMFNINLPTNISTWYPWRTDYRRRRSTDDIHLTFYSLIESMLNLNGLDGRACLQKSFCQMKESPIGHHDLPHQLLNIIFGLTFIVSSLALLGSCNGSDRNKRQLMYPPESIMQLAFAVITPGEVKGRMLTTNLGIMFNINLPTNISTWYPWRTDYRRRRSTDDIHLTFYSLIESMLTLNGLDGRACLQKSFCQMKESPIGHHDLPHQLLNIIFGHNQNQKDIILEANQTNTCDAIQSHISNIQETFSNGTEAVCVDDSGNRGDHSSRDLSQHDTMSSESLVNSTDLTNIDTANFTSPTTELHPTVSGPALLESALSDKVRVSPGVLTYSETLKQSNGVCAGVAVISPSIP
ncbi:uncharacterized protein LOC129003505 [Macrosteles quadrilineatus]|uniref:uncharacterized protein LOC129003505 n=1 Tax=Macrosteles quadrilineatus TaxID=74068 RepID=UPI0023E322AB|nr:uncharacterized protein LOC129003505 [Macrosteles quadrilineatus]